MGDGNANGSRGDHTIGRQAMVLAAGLGSRMRPITDRMPKPLVEIAGRAMIDQVLDRLAAAGVGKAVVNLHHLADQLEAHLAPRTAPKIVLSDERDVLLETGGGVKRALPLLGTNPFFVLNSDAIWIEGPTPLLEAMRTRYDAAEMDMLLAVSATVSSTGYDGRGDFHMAPDGRLTRRRQGAIAPFVYIGVALMTANLFADTPDGAFSLNLLFDRAIERERLFGIRLDGLSMHVGTPDSIALAELAISESVT
ncbi:MAG: nucleotidyltransferase family protein [Pseudomonadota bacterium]